MSDFKIYDGFIINDELDLLELRLMELGDLVDTFVIVEMAHTFMQKPKPLHFEEHKHETRFRKWLHKIHHIALKDEYPVGDHPIMEHHQRRQIAQGFWPARPCDVLMMGDLDEIPSRKLLEQIRQLPPEHPFTTWMKLYYYYVNCEQASPWAGTVIGPRHSFGEEIDCQQIRHDRHNFPRLFGAGWHFSWLGPLENIQRKLDSIDVTRDAALYGRQTEFHKPATTDKDFLNSCLETGKDLFGRETDYARKFWVPIEPGVRQPGCILKWLGEHPQYAKETEYADQQRPKGKQNKQKDSRRKRRDRLGRASS